MTKRTRLVYQTARSFERELHEYLLRELRALRVAVPVEDLAGVLSAAKEAQIFELVDTAGMKGMFASLDTVLLRGATAGALTAAEELGRKAVLDAARPRIKIWLRDHAAELVRETMGTSKRAVRLIVQSGIEQGRHPMRLARDVQNVVGLTEPHAIAVSRRREYLLNQPDMPTARANKLADDYGESLIKVRAQTIARNESLTAVNAGRSELWQQLREDGALSAKQLQEWDSALDGARCPRCAAMHKQQRSIGEAFEGPDGEQVIAPPLHVQCRCVVNLIG